MNTIPLPVHLHSALVAVWSNIGPELDCDDDAGLDNETCIEMCLDADRLSTFGYPEMQHWLNETCKHFDFRDVCKQIAQQHQIL